MELTNKQKAIKERRKYVYDAYLDNEAARETNDTSKYMPVSVLVQILARRFKVTTVQIYNDIKAEKYLKQIAS